MANSHAQLTSLLSQQELFRQSPFTLLDVGCSGGIDPSWRQFGSALIAHAFDPQASECERLRSQETSGDIHYHAAWVVGRPEDRVSREITPEVRYHFEHDLSYVDVTMRGTVPAQMNSVGESLVARERTVFLPDFVADAKLATVDFVKIDTDGHDIEILKSVLPLCRDWSILGFLCEVNFAGPPDEDSNCFCNIDRITRAGGYFLADLSTMRYSMDKMPAQFILPIAGPTRYGRPYQGDALYLRDLSSPDYLAFWAHEPTVHQILKAVCLYELFHLPDFAAATIFRWKDKLLDFADEPTIGAMLDLLTPPLKGIPLSYNDYMSAFRNNIDFFLP